MKRTKFSPRLVTAETRQVTAAVLGVELKSNDVRRRVMYHVTCGKSAIGQPQHETF